MKEEHERGRIINVEEEFEKENEEENYTQKKKYREGRNINMQEGHEKEEEEKEVEV